MEAKSSPSRDRQNVSFKFTKTASKALSGNRLDEENKDFVTSVDKSEIKSTLSKPKPTELVIPLIKKNKWRDSYIPENSSSGKEMDLNNLAVQELLKETSEKNAQWENREFTNMTVSIPLIMQNKIPDGFETDDKMDVSLRPDEPKIEDYDRIPVEQYGMAVLRGMGWKEETGIGNKGPVAPIQATLRPKGLGLGADASVLKKNQEKAKEQKLELIKGAYVHIVQGQHKGFYGQVLGLDEENARVIVKLTTDEKPVTLPEFYIEVVTKKEFDKEKKVINRATYETYKRKEEEKHEEEQHTNKIVEEGDSTSFKSEKTKDKDRKSKETDSRTSDKQSKKRHRSRERSEENHNYTSKAAKLWVKPQLRVRFIDDKYKKGKYFNQKMIVEDVMSSKYCCCKTEDGKYLDDVSPSMLETVVPRNESAYVMIVQGKHTGELCTILKKDKSKCIATVQFLSDRNQALKIEYDSICEYVGDVTQFD